MNWDWDKLQEKRQRQNWGNSNNNSNNNNNNNKNDEEPPFGSGSGNGGGKGPDYEKFSDAFKRLPHLSAPAGRQGQVDPCRARRRMAAFRHLYRQSR